MDESEEEPNYWSGPLGARAKALLLAGLALCYVIQTGLVYSDEPGRTQLSPRAEAGRRIFHERGCVNCHQLYGFGGFLGPDLTNAAERVTATRLQTLLTEGSSPMPAFHMKAEEIAAVRAFLEAMNATGRGQARITNAGPPPQARFVNAIKSELARAPDAPAQRGFELFVGRACFACHYPFAPSPVGAPDLSLVAKRLDAAALEKVLTEGRPPRMPNPFLKPEERADVAHYFGWLNAHRESLSPQVLQLVDVPVGDLPWWEYR